MVIEWFRVQHGVSGYINKVQINFPTVSLKCFDIVTNRAASLIIVDIFIEEIFEC